MNHRVMETMRSSDTNGTGIVSPLRPEICWRAVARQIGILVLSMMFAAAAITKSLEFNQLVAAISVSRLLPDRASPFAAAVVLLFEYWVAVGVWIHQCRRWTLRVSCGLCWVFLWYHVWMWLNNIPAPCHCFGSLFKIPPPVGLSIDVVLLATSAALLRNGAGPGEVRRPAGDVDATPRLPVWTRKGGPSDPDLGAWRMSAVMTLMGGALFAVVGAQHGVTGGAGVGVVPPAHVNATPATVIGPGTDFLGDSRSPYTLVEFGDYECPPCRAAAATVRRLVEQYRGQLRVVFRDLPLDGIHPFARDAAVAAEAARKQGKFWPMHDGLYSAPPDALHIASLERSLGLDIARLRRDEAGSAADAVRSDERRAVALGARGTPSYFLCRPEGRVLVLDSLDQLGDALQAPVKKGG